MHESNEIINFDILFNNDCLSRLTKNDMIDKKCLHYKSTFELMHTIGYVRTVIVHGLAIHGLGLHDLISDSITS